jgi:hypothetical protein
VLDASLARNCAYCAWIAWFSRLAGCYETPHAPERAVWLLKDEIATIGSYAKMSGKRSPEMVAWVESDTQAAIRHVDDIK